MTAWLNAAGSSHCGQWAQFFSSTNCEPGTCSCARRAVDAGVDGLNSVHRNRYGAWQDITRPRILAGSGCNEGGKENESQEHKLEAKKWSWK